MTKKKAEVVKVEMDFPRFKTQYNAPTFVRHYEKNTGELLTQPDQALPMRTILEKYRRTGIVEGNKQMVYDDNGNGEEIYIPDLRKMDLSEIHEMVEENRKAIASMQKVMQDKEQERLQAELYEEFKKQYEKEKQPEEAGSPPEA